MSTLERLAEKNKKHTSLVKGENQLAQIVFVNYVSLCVVTSYEVFKAQSFLTPDALTAFGSSLAFSLLLASLGADMVVRHWARILLLTICNTWFCYYWIWVGDTKAAFLPLALVFVMWRKWFYWQLFKKLRNGT